MTSRLKTPRSKTALIIITVYLSAVVTCIVLAFDFIGRIEFEWTLVLIGLTLPWSLVSVVFAWALIHGAGLEFFTFMYLCFAGINSGIFYKMFTRDRSKSDE